MRENQGTIELIFDIAGFIPLPFIGEVTDAASLLYYASIGDLAGAAASLAALLIPGVSAVALRKAGDAAKIIGQYIPLDLLSAAPDKLNYVIDKGREWIDGLIDTVLQTFWEAIDELRNLLKSLKDSLNPQLVPALETPPTFTPNKLDTRTTKTTTEELYPKPLPQAPEPTKTPDAPKVEPPNENLPEAQKVEQKANSKKKFPAPPNVTQVYEPRKITSTWTQNGEVIIGRSSHIEWYEGEDGLIYFDDTTDDIKDVLRNRLRNIVSAEAMAKGVNFSKWQAHHIRPLA